MSLFYREIGQGEQTVVILHGLYGSSDNWMTIAKKLSRNFRIILPDQRNHGHSFHHNIHSYEAMASDLLELLNQLKVSKICLAGHSMGGKSAMRFAINYPEMIDCLAVIDIAPKKYNFDEITPDIVLNHCYIINSLISTNIQTLNSRNEIDLLLEKKIPNKALRSFLMKNIFRNSKNKFQWRLNLESLKNNLDEISDGFSNAESFISLEKKPNVLFIKGETSSYIADNDIPVINHFFPNAKLITIPDTGHWLHAEKPDYLVKILTDFFIHFQNI